MRFRTSLILACAALVALGGCRAAFREARRDDAHQRQDEAQVLASLARYRTLTLESDAQRLAELFDAEGELSHDGEAPTLGRDNIRTFFASLAGFKVTSYELTANKTSITGRSAKQTCTYSQRALSPDGKGMETNGSFEATWSHQADGRWLLRRMHTEPGALAAGG